MSLRPLGLLILAVVPAGVILPALAAPAQDAPHPGYLVVQRECLKCHGEGSTLSGLDLRTLASARQGGTHGPAVRPGDPTASRLMDMVTGKRKPQMPPTGGLADRDVAALRAWIAAGAPYPATTASAAPTTWWAFRTPVRAGVPAGAGAWAKSPVDSFVHRAFRQNGLAPGPSADRTTLIRRVTFDLHGLPPTPEETAAFVADRAPGAYERVVDRLLASPRYGERWGRHWLDLARFAESEGFKADETRPNAWRYRDYVIQSLNADKPYDAFIREQIAGDEIAPDRTEALVATAFNRHWADESNARNLRLRRQEILNDITDTVSSVVLGLTLACARCHDHKYDPLSHKDYYRLQAFFAAVQPQEEIPLVSADERAEHERRRREWEIRTEPIRTRLAAMEAPHRTRLMVGKRMPFPPEVLEAVDTPAANRTALQWQIYWKLMPQLEIGADDLSKAMKGEEKARWEAATRELAAFDTLKPAPLPTTQGIRDVGPVAPPTHTLAIGVYDQPLEAVSPGVPAVLSGLPLPAIRPIPGESTGRRAALAGWLTSPQNPLTARVMVNRIWQGHFGRGLVGTTSDFGRSGDTPSHPELLDYLAHWFSSPAPDGAGWSLKALHRLLVTSATYQQSSSHRPEAARRDPDNRLLWRFRRWRLEGEAIRDAALAAAGDLNDEMGGPSVFPELPVGVATRGGWPVSKSSADRNRRSVYIFVRRNLRYPLFEAFDFPDTHEPCARRSVTNTAPQALMLFNSELTLGIAQGMAGRLIREAAAPEARVERAYRLAFGRAPETAEREQALRFLAGQAGVIADRLRRGEPVAGPRGAQAAVEPAEGAALVDFCHALLNASEFTYVD